MTVPIDQAVRARAAELLRQNVPVKDIAVQLDLPKSTVYTWKTKMPAGEGAYDPRLKEKAIAMRDGLTPVKIIAAQLGVPVGTVYEWLRVKGRGTRLDPQLKRRVYEMRAANAKPKDIALAVGLPIQTVYYWLNLARKRAVSLVVTCRDELEQLSLGTDAPNLPTTLARLSRHLTAALKGFDM